MKIPVASHPYQHLLWSMSLVALNRCLVMSLWFSMHFFEDQCSCAYMYIYAFLSSLVKKKVGIFFVTSLITHEAVFLL